jgi:hypothetical protein
MWYYIISYTSGDTTSFYVPGVGFINCGGGENIG